MALETFLTPILSSLTVGILLAIFNRKQSRKDEEVNDHEELRIEGESVKLDLLLAATKLSYATAKAWQRGSANGEVEEGIDQYNIAMENFKTYERHLVVHNAKE